MTEKQKLSELKKKGRMKFGYAYRGNIYGWWDNLTVARDRGMEKAKKNNFYTYPTIWITKDGKNPWRTYRSVFNEESSKSDKESLIFVNEKEVVDYISVFENSSFLEKITKYIRDSI